VPDQPIAPTTTISALNTVVSWTAPYHGGVAISSYTISLIDNTGTYVEDTTVCNGSDPAIVSALECTIPSSHFITEPYELEWGTSIQAKVIATNVRGSSLQSDSGNGAVIETNPDAPVSLQDAPLVTAATQVGLTWLEGAANGGTAVIDYRISYD
jgi:hypothetical protein